VAECEPAARRIDNPVEAAAMSLRACVLTAGLVATTAVGVGSIASAVGPTADAIVSDYVKARGGLDKIRSVKTLRESGHAFAGPGREAVVRRELMRPNRTRFEFTLQGVTSVFVSDGTHAYKMSPFDGDGSPQPLPPEVVAEAAEQADIEGPLVDWKAKGHRIELAGHETIDGRDAYKLKLTLKSGGLRYEYIDVATHDRLRTESTRTMQGHPVRLTMTFGDYHVVSGLRFPGKVEIAAEGRPQTLRLVVEKVEINPPLSDDRFQPPPS
jgi:outer membrane lipoprotein-sorting protein